MELIFLGTGGAWGVPELHCDCRICREMRERGEKRDRTALLLRGQSTLLVDCGPDARHQLCRNGVEGVDGVLITHEHTDHYIGLDELFAYKRNRPRGAFRPIPVYLTKTSHEVVQRRFDYLESLEVIRFCIIEPGSRFQVNEFEVLPFATDHGASAKGSVGFLLVFPGSRGETVRMVYTSDFFDIPNPPPDLFGPDYLVIQSFWLNEPIHNRPHHMSFQRAIGYIERLGPRRETFLVHIGDADMAADDRSNANLKKYEPKDPLRPPLGGDPYPIPLHQAQWQETVTRILRDRQVPYAVTVAWDDLCIRM